MRLLPQTEPPTAAASAIDVPVAHYVAGLRRCFAQRDCEPQVCTYLRHHRPDRQSLRPFMRWQPGTYTRNILHREDRFELLLLCWDFEAASPVHGHAGRRSWTQIVSGALLVETFDSRTLQHPSQQPADLAHTCHRLRPGDLDFRGPTAPAHRLANTGGPRQLAMSLHIYARPLRELTVYDPRTGTAARRAP